MEILDSRYRYKSLQYLIKWRGYSDAEASWRRADDAEHAERLVKEYHERYPHKPGLEKRKPAARAREQTPEEPAAQCL